MKNLLKKAFPWLGIILYLSDVVLDIKVGVGYIQNCHYNYGISVLAFFCLPGLLCGGFFSLAIIGQDILKNKYGYDVGHGEKILLFLVGTFLGPIMLIPGTVYLLVKTAINPSSDDDNGSAKV